MNGRIESLRAHLRDPLYRNGYALILNTAVTAGLGFIFSLLAPHVYPTEVVGRALAQVAAMMLISALTQINFTSVLVRFLPRAGNHSRKLVLSCYAIAAAFAAVAATVVLLLFQLIGSNNPTFDVSFPFGVWFVLATATWSIFNLQDGTLTGMRRSIWVPVENGAYNIAKIVLLFAFQPLFGDASIFAATTVPVAVSLLPVNWAIFTRFMPHHIESSKSREQIPDRKTIRRYVAGDYTSTIFAQAMTTLMPVIVASVLGSKAVAYFFIAQTMSMVLDLVSYNLASSLTVEAAGAEHRIKELMRDVLKKLLILVVPAAILLWLAAPLILGLYPSDYGDGATDLLRLLALACIPKIFISIHGSLSRLQHKTHRNAVVTGIQATLLVGGSIVLMNMMGLKGAGYAILFSQTIVALLVLPYLWKMLHYRPRHLRQ